MDWGTTSLYVTVPIGEEMDRLKLESDGRRSWMEHTVEPMAATALELGYVSLAISIRVSRRKSSLIRLSISSLTCVTNMIFPLRILRDTKKCREQKRIALARTSRGKNLGRLFVREGLLIVQPPLWPLQVKSLCDEYYFFGVCSTIPKYVAQKGGGSKIARMSKR